MEFILDSIKNCLIKIQHLLCTNNVLNFGENWREYPILNI